jgi:hypothetical protein
MAKSATKVAQRDTGIDISLLKKVMDATAAGQIVYLSSEQGKAMAVHTPPLIEVNTQMLDPMDDTKAAVRATLAATVYLAETGTVDKMIGGTPTAIGNYAIITGAVLPEPKKRGNSFGSGAPTKYPFADLPVGGMFFSANTEHAKGDAVKALGSTVSSQNRKYAIETGETKTQKRAKRDDNNQPILDANGKKIVETVTLPVLKYERKFTIRPVIAGKTYGNWTAPADGALIGRTV